MAAPIVVPYEMDEGDYQALLKRRFWPLHRQLLILFWLLMPAAAAFLTWRRLEAAHSVGWDWLSAWRFVNPVTGGLGLAVLLGFPLLGLWLLRSGGRRVHRQAQEAGENRGAISLEDGVLVDRVQVSETRIPLAAVQAIQKTPTLLLLVINPLRTVVVPRRCFGQNVDEEAFVNAIQAGGNPTIKRWP